jgi:hypothetical protein
MFDMNQFAFRLAGFKHTVLKFRESGKNYPEKLSRENFAFRVISVTNLIHIKRFYLHDLGQVSRVFQLSNDFIDTFG